MMQARLVTIDELRSELQRGRMPEFTYGIGRDENEDYCLGSSLTAARLRQRTRPPEGRDPGHAPASRVASRPVS